MAKKKPKSEPLKEGEIAAQTPEEYGQIVFEMAANKPAPTIPNLQKLLDIHGITCRYNVISKQYELLIPNESFTADNADTAALALVASRMTEMGLPTTHYKEYLGYIGDKHQYNPVLEWVKSKKWDGINRIDELCQTITAKNEEAKNLFMRRWLITAMYMAMHDGYDSPGCMVLQGKQGLGKTWWFRKLCPIPNLIRTDASVDPRNRDSVSQIIRYWIVELGEIGSTFKRADIDALKAFITAQSDILRRPYASTDQVYPRRTALAASVNEHIFLHDTTGNRRYFTIQCLAINSYHKIDMQQVWAEVHHLIDQCEETPHLTDHERELVDRINCEHMQIDPIEEMIMAKYDWENDFIADWKTATQIGRELEIKNITQSETRKIATFIRKLNNNDENKQKLVMGQRKFLIPPPRQ